MAEKCVVSILVRFLTLTFIFYYCGNRFNPGSVKILVSAWSFTCSGHSVQIGGASNRMDIYVRTIDSVIVSKFTYLSQILCRTIC